MIFWALSIRYRFSGKFALNLFRQILDYYSCSTHVQRCTNSSARTGKNYHIFMHNIITVCSRSITAYLSFRLRIITTVMASPCTYIITTVIDKRVEKCSISFRKNRFDDFRSVFDRPGRTEVETDGFSVRLG